MNQPIRVMLVEDSPADALLLLRQLRMGGYEPISERVETAQALLASLKGQSWDLIISDYVVPGFGGLDALDLIKRHGFDLPFIIVSGQIGEDIAVQAMKSGAHDYLMKGSLTRLVPAVERELREAETRRQRREADLLLKSTAEKLLQTNQELRRVEEELRGRNAELVEARDELEKRVIQRTAALSKANSELRHHIEERKRLELELLDITEQERQRIGIDLHDDLGQQLTGIAFMIKGLHQRLENESPDRAVEAEKIHSLVSRTIQHAHDLALDLASDLEGENLAPSLKQLAHRVKSLFAVQCEFESDGELPALQPAVSAHLYKIAQEALTNAIKHGKARRLALKLSLQERKLTLSIWNDGMPFPVNSSQKGRMGLRIMNYRANVVGAWLEIHSDEQSGTAVICSLPLAAEITLPVSKTAAAAD